jgi:hypothetical protein
MRIEDLRPRCGGHPPAVTPRKDRTVKNLLQMLVNFFGRAQSRSIEERYLAQAVDAQDLEVRLRALERAKP